MMDNMSETDNGGPAFPEAGMSGLPNNEFVHGRPGMTLRDYFAAVALPALIQTSSGTRTLAVVAAEAYRYADAMLKERQA